jgi:hypothetical protein
MHSFCAMIPHDVCRIPIHVTVKLQLDWGAFRQTRSAASAGGYDVQLDLYPDGLGGAVT